MECNWFCCEDCDVIHASLRKLVNNGENFVPYWLLSMLKRNSSLGEFADDREADIHWQILSGKYVRDDLLFHKVIGLFHVSCIFALLDKKIQFYLKTCFLEIGR